MALGRLSLSSFLHSAAPAFRAAQYMVHPSRCLPGLHLLYTWSFPLKHCTDQYAAMLFSLDRVSTDMRELICTMRLSLCNPSPFTAPHSLDLAVVLWRIDKHHVVRRQYQHGHRYTGRRYEAKPCQCDHACGYPRLLRCRNGNLGNAQIESPKERLCFVSGDRSTSLILLRVDSIRMHPSVEIPRARSPNPWSLPSQNAAS